MPWYSTGTVAVTNNSATVTGIGTAFSANARVGDAFIGPDLGLYEVTNIASATVISIRPNYRGATASGQSYAIAPLQGYVKESADRLRQLTDLIGGSPWLQATTPEDAREALGATTVGEALFTAINAVAALNALGASDVGKALIAATSEQAAREALGAEDASTLTAGFLDIARIPATLTADKAFRRGNILGTVSRSGGIPTGAIIERGSNVTGEYVRFADGTQICWSRKITNSELLAGRSVSLNPGSPPAAFVGDFVLQGSASLFAGLNATGAQVYAFTITADAVPYAFNQGRTTGEYFTFSMGTTTAQSRIAVLVWHGRWY